MSFQPRTVVCIDSDADARFLVELSLTRDPTFRLVGTAATLEDALPLLADQRPDVIVLDRILPDGDALQHLRELRSLAGGAAVFVLTAQVQLFAEPLVRAAGADGYIDKVDLARLAAVLHTMLRSAAAA